MDGMRLVFDLEANGLYDEATTIWCICAEDLETGKRYEWTSRPVKGSLGKPECHEKTGRPLFMDSATELIGHNILNYDLPLLKKLWNWEPKENVKITDTLVMSRTLYPDRPKPPNPACKGGPHSLEAWGYRVGKGKPEHEEWDVFSAAMLRRCNEDVGINVLTYHSLRSEAAVGNWDEAFEVEHEMARIMAKQEHRGIYFDKPFAEDLVRGLDVSIRAIDDKYIPQLPMEIEQVGTTVLHPFNANGTHSRRYRADISYCDGPHTRIKFVPFDLGSNGKIKDYLLDNGWIPEEWNFSKKTGERTSPKLKGDFEGVTGDLPIQVKRRVIMSHRRGQISGWLERLRPDGTLAAGANPCGTPTARMKHFNVVNIPKSEHYDKKHFEKGLCERGQIGDLIWDVEQQSVPYGTQMRALFIPRDGYTLVGHDASGLELRMLAHYMGDEDFINEILNGDIHEFNRRAAGLPDRNAAKTFIYAFLYGAGDAKLGSIVGGGKEAGGRLKRQFLKSLPKLDKLIKRVKRQSNKGYLEGLDGRRIIMRQDEDGRVMNHKALNTLLQCAGSLVMKRSCVLLWDRVEQAGYDAHKVLDMHDEGQSEVNPSIVEPYSKMAVQSIVDAGEHFNLNIPLDGEALVGCNMAETH